MIYQFPDFKIITQHKHLLKNSSLIAARIKRFDQHLDRTIFSSCHGNDGLALSADKRKQILSYLNEPTHEKWDTIYKMHVFPNRSLWDTWNSVSTNVINCVKNSSDVYDKWKTIPSPTELVNGIQKIRERELMKLLSLKNKIDNSTIDLELKYKNYLLKYA
jgi:hypothetical protein